MINFGDHLLASFFVAAGDGDVGASIMWCRGERRIGEPVSTAELARTFIGLTGAQQDPAEALASLAASAVQRLVAQR